MCARYLGYTPDTLSNLYYLINIFFTPITVADLDTTSTSNMSHDIFIYV